ncbi:MAG: hypothetical protein KBS81_10615 [Spirochaetales bacterium]|nr:hypothetical protein [Candidatus Physcosoma equi]
MDIVIVDLKNNEINKVKAPASTGLMLGLSLYEEYGKDAIVLTGSVGISTEKCGTNTWCMVYYSEYLGHRAFYQHTSVHGNSMFRMNIAAIVILGRSERLKYLSVYPENIELIPCEHMRSGSPAIFREVAAKTQSDPVLSTSPAADRGVKFGTLQSAGGRNLSDLGGGNAFYLHNLKGIVFQSYAVATPLKNEEKKKMFGSRFLREARSFGAYSFISSGQRLGWIPVCGYKDRFDPRAYSLDGKAMAERFGNYPESCGDCFIACGRRMRDNSSLPRWRETLSLGTNLGFFDPENVQKLYVACLQEGLDAGVIGGLLAHISSLTPEERSLYGITGRKVEEYCALIHRIGTGSILSEGLKAFPKAIQGFDGAPISFDLRGNYSEAITMSLGVSVFLPVTTLLPKYPVGAECAAILAFYQLVYGLALMTLGYPVFSTQIGYWTKMPEVVYHVPQLSRLAASSFSAYGYKAKDLLAIGLEVLDSLSLEWHGIPSYFIMNSESVVDSSTVPMRRLQEIFSVEKARLEIKVKSTKEKKAR